MTNKNEKIISISSKRQITIPLNYFESLGFNTEALCTMKNNSIVLTPITYTDPNKDDFSDEILKDLIAQGFEGDELLKEFKKQKKKIKPAIEKMSKDLDSKYKSGKLKTYNKIFNIK